MFLLLCLTSIGAPLISQYVTHYDPNRINLRENYAPPAPRTPSAPTNMAATT